MFKVNKWNRERTLRVVVGILMLAMGWGGYVTGPVGVFLQWFGFFPLLTGLIGGCPPLPFLGNRTCPIEVEKE